jgi:AraC-like DNA-binding protein
MIGTRPIIQKLPLESEHSFIAKTFRTPYFETPWHQHIEFEVALFLEGHGMCFVGNYVGEFKVGDVFLIGSNVPHAFYKNDGLEVASSLVVQFRDDFWGKEFLLLPENLMVRNLLDQSVQGIQLGGTGLGRVRNMLTQLEHEQGLSRILLLLQVLQLMESSCTRKELSTQQEYIRNEKSRQRLDEVFDFTIRHFHQRITLEEVAAIAHMSVTAFCRYFKKSTQKSYVEFLTEVRIGYACQQLQSTDKPVLEICYESGFNSPVNFNKQFYKLKHTTPRQFRSSFLEQLGK